MAEFVAQHLTWPDRRQSQTNTTHGTDTQYTYTTQNKQHAFSARLLLLTLVVDRNAGRSLASWLVGYE